MRLISRDDAISQGLTAYFTGKPCKHGHISHRRTYDWKCAECVRLKCVKWRRENKGYYREKYASCEKYRSNKKKQAVRYYKENKESVRLRSSEYDREWRSRPRSKSIMFMRGCLARIMRNKKTERTEVLIGYTRDDLRAHIESLFKEGMSWSNYGEWHIDHIKPISAFLDEGETCPKIINALENLQPLWASENLSKGASYDAGASSD